MAKGYPSFPPGAKAPGHLYISGPSVRKGAASGWHTAFICCWESFKTFSKPRHETFSWQRFNSNANKIFLFKWRAEMWRRPPFYPCSLWSCAGSLTGYRWRKSLQTITSWNGALPECREVWDKSCPSPEFRRVQIVSEIHAEHFWLECTLGSYRYVPWAAYKMSFQRQCHSLWVFFTFHFCTILLALISWHQCLWKPWHFWHRHRLTLVFSTISCRHPQLL